MTVTGAPLVIGIGNPLRSDDGVGWRLAAEWDRLQRTGCPARLLAVPQVLPELAATLAQHERVLFIDAVLPETGGIVGPAGVNPGPGPWMLPLLPSGDPRGSAAFSHSLEPAGVLALTAALYGRAPAAQRLLLHGHCLDHGTRYSPGLRRQLPTARALLQHWLEGGDA